MNDSHKRIIRGRATGWLLSLAAGVLLLYGCSRTVPLSEDESQIRKEFSIPSEVKMVSLWRSSDQPGTFGREGLRMVGEFRLTEQQQGNFVREAVGYGWKPLPVPGNVDTFRKPPVELPKDIKQGFYICSAWIYGQWVDGKKQESRMIGCEEVGQQKIDHYRIGILDNRTGRITVVYQNYY